MIGQKLDIEIGFTTKMLGTVPEDKDIYATFVASKIPLVDDRDIMKDMQDEIDDVPESDEKGVTGFLCNVENGGVYIKDHMIKGFIKSALETLIENTMVEKIPAYKKWIDRMVFVEPRKIFVGIDEPDGSKSRPLRASTAKGERVALAKSRYLKEGRTIKFVVTVLKNSKKLTPKAVAAAFDYGRYVGLGAWRGSGGYGRFTVKSIVTHDIDDEL